MSKLARLLRLRGSVKESLDNLPSGVCVFSENGLVVTKAFEAIKDATVPRILIAEEFSIV